MDLIGKVLSNRYEIIEEIGVGGMAHVYKARCNLLNRNVAVKVLKPEYSKDETFVKRFVAEAQSAASLTHPNIVSVFDVGEENGINYIVMELLESRTLKDYINEKGALKDAEVLKISMQIASGLEAAHKAHIVHRDIKPQNIVLNRDLIAKVTDFGIAKATTTATITNFGSTMGSVHYFSPEHAKGGYTDEKSDIYSLGVVMYEMATGRVPFDGDSPVSVALKHIQESPIPPRDLNPNISLELSDIILKAMAKNTVNRYKNATDMLVDINDAIHSSSSKRVSSIEAGDTLVIPTLDAEIVEDEIVVPNLRTRNSRRMTVTTTRNASSLKNISTNEDNKSDENFEDENDDSDTKVKKIKNDKKIIIIAVIVSAVILTIITSIFVVNFVKKIRSEQVNEIEYIVPNLVGRNFEEVVKEYEAQGIIIQQEKLEYDLTLKEGLVISQTPEKGMSVTNKVIKVVVSKGQKVVKLPDVKGKDLKVAKYELEDTLGFVLEIEEVVDEKVASGIIISQEQKAGEEYPYGSTIKLKVSKGDGKVKVIMPSVLNKTKDEAIKAIEALKLSVKVTYKTDSTKPNGVVISQSYPQNQELSEGDLVEITVNRIQVSKTITLNLADIVDISTIETEKINIKVIASIDGSAENTVYDKSVSKDSSSVSFTINGYTTASFKIYVNEKQVKSQNIDFTK